MQVDEEIKNYISLHKHDLMAGMQDVAVLSKRYQTLQATSNRLRLSVDKTKRETFNSYSLVRDRTLELERIHETAVLLRQLRQFTHAKAQLDHYSSATASLASGSNKKNARNGVGSELDLRQFATIAKTVQELEHLLLSPQLVTLQVVKGQVAQIRTFGGQLRELAREKLLGALRDQDQTTVADCLQVYFNLHSLPQAVLMAIDATVKDTIELSAAALNLDLVSEGSSASASSSTSKKNGGNGGGESLLTNASQLRVAMREMCHSWASVVQEQAVKIHVLQRVISKKEDPATHQKFITVLQSSSFPSYVDQSFREQGQDIPLVSGSGSKVYQSPSLLEIFWQRLAVSLQDVLATKINLHPVAAPRIYPNLRRAAVEVYDALQVLTVGDMRDGDAPFSGGDGLGLFDDGDCDDGNGSCSDDNQYNNGHRRMGLFGSVGAVSAALSASRSAPGLVVTPATYGCSRAKKAAAENKKRLVGERGGGISPRSSVHRRKHSDATGHSPGLSGEAGLLPSLVPLRDRYLLSALSRMTAPVLQMFPEVEGYTAAVPSKRDLQALLKAVQEDVVHAVLEGDRTLVRIVAKEAFKAVRLLLTKVEGMVSNGLESTRIHLSKDGRYVKTNQQEHNIQLLQLLSQLTDFVEKLPAQIIKVTKDSPSFALSRLLGPDGVGLDGECSGEAVLEHEMKYFVSESIRCAHELAGRQLLHPLVDALALHFRHLLLGLLKEGATGGTGPSKTLTTLLDQFPQAAETFLVSSSTSSTKSSSATLPVPVALKELCARLILTYTSIAALRRPVNERTRLLTASEISALELMVTGLLPQGEDKHNPVFAELRCFRRLLFDPIEENSLERGGHNQDTQQDKDKKNVQALGSDVAFIPRPSLVLALPYLMSLRPSTVLGYLISCGPRQLPSIADAATSSVENGGNATPGKKNKSLDSLILSSDAASVYVKMLTSPSDSEPPIVDAYASTSGRPVENGRSDELQLLGASVSQAFAHSAANSWKNVSDYSSDTIARYCSFCVVLSWSVCKLIHAHVMLCSRACELDISDRKKEC